jgi:hypothetical protein
MIEAAAEFEQGVRELFEQGGGAVTAAPVKITMGGCTTGIQPGTANHKFPVHHDQQEASREPEAQIWY